MSADPEYASELIGQIANVTPDADLGNLMTFIASAALAEAVKSLGFDEVAGRVVALLTAMEPSS